MKVWSKFKIAQWLWVLGQSRMIIMRLRLCGYNIAHGIFQINARTELALRYNDISPLENHHCSVAFELLAKRDCNIFRNVSQEQYKRIREGIIRYVAVILSWDQLIWSYLISIYVDNKLFICFMHHILYVHPPTGSVECLCDLEVSAFEYGIRK